MIRKFVDLVPEEQIQTDLEKYRNRAIELGASDAKIITTDKIIIDERVIAKCTYPKCRNYGTNANCPPYAMGVDLMRKVVSKFRYAIFIQLKIPSTEVAGEAPAKQLNVNSPYRRKLPEIVSKIEAEAFYDGYHLALGFVHGSCKTVFCSDKECSALIPGKACRFSLKARSSMEAVGMDCYTMATRAGWDIYPIGRAVSPDDVPHGTRLSLVLIT